MLGGGPLPGPGGRGSPGVPLRGQLQFPGTQSDRWDLGNPICCPDCPPPTHTPNYQHLTTVAGEPGTARTPRLPGGERVGGFRG